MTDFDVGARITFAGETGEITGIEKRPNGSHPLRVYTTDGQLRTLPGELPGG